MGDNDKKCRACEYQGDNFYVIRGTFYVDRSDGYIQNLEEVDILACPKCGTLQIHEWWIHED